MKLTRLLEWSAVLSLTFALGALAGKAPRKIEITRSNDMKWQVPPGLPADAPGPRMVLLWGDPVKGPVGVLLKQPAGASSGLHSHSADYQAVVIQGEVTATETDDTDAAGFGPGSFWKQPSKEWHNNVCKSSVDCISYIVFTNGGIDIKPKPATN